MDRLFIDKTGTNMARLLLLTLLFTLFALQPCPVHSFDNAPTLDPMIPTMSPHVAPNSDSCVGQCALQFVDNMTSQLGPNKAAGLLNLNYNDFLTAFSNSTFFEKFCSIYHNFQYCYTKCPHGYMQELLLRSAAIIDHFCVYNYQAILTHFPCLSQIDKEVSSQCIKGCTPQHDAVASLMQNFKHLALNGDSSEAEKYLNKSCEYVTCSLHCDVPAIAHTCSFETADLVINLTRKSFASMESLALDTGAVSKWPSMCADIKTYRMPKPGEFRDAVPPEHSDKIIAQNINTHVLKTNTTQTPDNPGKNSKNSSNVRSLSLLLLIVAISASML